MTPFEYVSVLISIILGLGITTVLTGVADLVKNWEKAKFFTPHTIWIVLVFVLHVHEWWVSYSLRTIAHWHIATFLFVMLYPINLYILAHLLFPGDKADSGFDLKTFYFRSYRRFFGSAILLVIISIIENLSIGGFSLKDQFLQFALLLVLGTMVIIKSARSNVHTAVAALFLAILLISLLVTADELVI